MTTLEFDKKVKCGPEYVALRIIDNCEQLKIGNIWLPNMTGENGRLARCVIEDCGVTAASEYGLKPGDYVMIDRLSTFAHTAPVCMCRFNNVICLTNKDGTIARPLKDMVFVEPITTNDVKDIGNGVYVPGNYGEKLNIGVITDSAVVDTNYPFAVGEKVIVTKGADLVEFGSHKLYIYKKDMLVCKVVDDETAV